MAKRKPDATVQPADILAEHSPKVRAIAERLRDLVRQTVPEAAEKAYPGWHAIGYRHPTSGYFCGIFPQADQALLLFEFGILLPDPDKLLEGDGKQVRYVVIADVDDVQVEPIQSLLKAALDLPGSREAKLDMIHNAAWLIDDDREE